MNLVVTSQTHHQQHLLATNPIPQSHWLLIAHLILRDQTVTMSPHSNAPPVNTSSSQATENTSISPTAKELNNTSLIASTDNKINNNPPPITTTQNNDSSNNKKSSEKSISGGQPKSKDQLAPTALTEGNTTHEKASSVTQDKNIIDTKHETSQNKLTGLRAENDSNTLVENVKNKGTSSQESKAITSQNSATENDNDKNKVTSEQIKVNNRPVAGNDEATTESSIPVKIKQGPSTTE